jgi:hypothetical protein
MLVPMLHPGTSLAQSEQDGGAALKAASRVRDGEAGAARPDRPPARASVRLDPAPHEPSGRIPAHFVGLSVEWSLVERYMGDRARPVFANLLRNTGTGMLRIGGISQDLMRFEPSAANTNQVITPEDLASIRATLELADATEQRSGTPSWGAILGTAMSPPSEARPWLGPDHARTFVAEGVKPAFSGDGHDARRYVAGIELGNEPDISYDSDVVAYLNDFASHAEAVLASGFGPVGPNSSEPIAPWASIKARGVPTRFFWEWPAILQTVSPYLKAEPGAFGAFATDHFYPMSRSCASDPYRCATIARLLSAERMSNFEYEVHTHAVEAARHGLAYRVEEMNSAANRGVEGVSDVAASSVWALDSMFSAACPQPPDDPGANAECTTGAIGVNFHNAERRAFFFPEEGNAFYNAINYDPTATMGPPTAAPVYYAMLLFASFAQDTSGLRRVAVSSDVDGMQVKAWEVEADDSERRLFLINKGLEGPVTVSVAAGGPGYEVVRMSPHDPTGAGRTLNAPDVRIDGRAVGADGTWPGFAPTIGRADAETFQITLAPAEAAVLMFGRDD